METAEKPECRVFIATAYDSARLFASEHGGVDATVEAEYGNRVIQGREVTLAHHGDLAGHPAPCNDPAAVPLPAGRETTILVSHLDLDAMGGILALEGQKPEDPEFWKAAEFIDVNGPHHIHELPERVQDKLNAFYAYVADVRSRYNIGRHTEAVEVTGQVKDYGAALEKIVDERAPEHAAMIERGREWQRETTKAVEDCLVQETDTVRVFSTNGPFCGGAYYSPARQKIIPAVITYNERFKSISLSFADGGRAHSAKKIVQELWGPGAGGRDGIAGSPRGQEMTMDDLTAVFGKVMELAPERAREAARDEPEAADSRCK